MEDDRRSTSSRQRSSSRLMKNQVEDSIIQKLTDENNRSMFREQTKTSARPIDFDKQCLLTLEEIELLISKCIHITMEQPMLLDLPPPINICGDIHGQFLDLLWVFKCGKYPPAANYLFLGDYIDRGTYSIECICLLMSFKVKYPNKFFLLRGNHESNPVNENYGFRVECEYRFNRTLWYQFGQYFDCLPCAAIVGGKIFCVHGGLSEHLKNFDQIRKIQRPIQTPIAGLLCDLVWADPDKGPTGYRENSARAISVRFGTDVIHDFLKRMNISLIVRAHEVMRKGYEIIGRNALMTVFSAPNYTGVFGNDGAILNVNENLECTVHILNYKHKRAVIRSNASPSTSDVPCAEIHNVFKHSRDNRSSSMY